MTYLTSIQSVEGRFEVVLIIFNETMILVYSIKTEINNSRRGHIFLTRRHEFDFCNVKRSLLCILKNIKYNLLINDPKVLPFNKKRQFTFVLTIPSLSL